VTDQAANETRAGELASANVTRRLSACEWIFGGRSLQGIVSALRNSGYDALVIVGDPERSDLEDLVRITTANGLEIGGLTADTAGRAERDLAHPDRELRKQAVSYFQGCVQLAGQLGAAGIGVHPSAEGRLAARTSYANEWQLSVAAVRELAYFAGEHGVTIAVEPLNRYEAFLVNRIEQAVAFADEVDVPGVGIVADLFHMNIEEADLGAALQEGMSHVLEIHLADSNRRGLGHGHIRFTEVMTAVSDFEGPFVMEFTASDEDALDGYLSESAGVFRNLMSETAS
jgi:sugar phosphate isomerase/epimerase